MPKSTDNKKADLSSDIEGISSQADDLLKALDSIEERAGSPSKSTSTRITKVATPAKPETGKSSSKESTSAEKVSIVTPYSWLYFILFLIPFAFLQFKERQAEPAKKQAQSESYLQSGFTKFTSGDNQGAIADYSKAIALNPQSAEAYNNRGAAKYNLGDKQGASADYNKAIEINPQYANAYGNRGIVKYDFGNNQGAITDYNKAIAINPQYADAYNNRGLVKFDFGNNQGAITDYNKAIAINPQHADSYSNRGTVKFDFGDQQGACSDYKKAASLGHRSTAQWLQSDGGSWCRNMR